MLTWVTHSEPLSLNIVLHWLVDQLLNQQPGHKVVSVTQNLCIVLCFNSKLWCNTPAATTTHTGWGGWGGDFHFSHFMSNTSSIFVTKGVMKGLHNRKQWSGYNKSSPRLFNILSLDQWNLIGRFLIRIWKMMCRQLLFILIHVINYKVQGIGWK